MTLCMVSLAYGWMEKQPVNVTLFIPGSAALFAGLIRNDTAAGIYGDTIKRNRRVTSTLYQCLRCVISSVGNKKQK